MKTAMLALVLVAACNRNKQPPTTPIIPAITQREAKPMAPRPEPMPLRVQPQGRVADPPTDEPRLPPVNPGTNGARDTDPDN